LGTDAAAQHFQAIVYGLATDVNMLQCKIMTAASTGVSPGARAQAAMGALLKKAAAAVGAHVWTGFSLRTRVVSTCKSSLHWRNCPEIEKTF